MGLHVTRDDIQVVVRLRAAVEFDFLALRDGEILPIDDIIRLRAGDLRRRTDIDRRPARNDLIQDRCTIGHRHRADHAGSQSQADLQCQFFLMC